MKSANVRGEPLLRIIDEGLSKIQKHASVSAPAIQMRTAPIVLPPRWAGEVPRRLLSMGIVGSPITRPIVFQQAFVHKSFSGDAFCNSGLESLGHQILLLSMQHWLLAADLNVSADTLRSVGTILPDEVLSSLATRWGVGDLVLSDASQYSAEMKSAGRARHAVSLPVHVSATVIPAICGAFFVDGGLNHAMQFATEKVLSPILSMDHFPPPRS